MPLTVVRAWRSTAGFLHLGVVSSAVMTARSRSTADEPREPGLRDELLVMAADADPARRAARAERLWEILDDYESWPGWRMVGRDGSAAAWTLAQSAIDDVGLERRCLEMLEIAVACGDADPVHLAYLSDRVRMNDGRDQLYGSQFVLGQHGELEPWPVDDAAAVDVRRARLGLPPFQVHAATMRARWEETRAQS
jgi:hypothetical protein